jgi:hypothetical protein
MRQAREPAPLWVRLACVLLVLASLTYFAGYLVIEDILGYLK